MAFSSVTALLIFAALCCFEFHWVVVANDPDPMQDVCVADLSGAIHVNGYPCKNSSLLTAEDFIFHGLARTASTNNPVRANATFGTVNEYPGLNTLGLSIARLDLAEGGLIPPHTHPRASEMIYVVKGSLYAGFVTAANKLYAKVIHEGDVMIFLRALIHFQLNVGKGNAIGIVTLNSQWPGFQLIANSMFGSDIMDEVLVKTFHIDQRVISQLKSIFGSTRKLHD